MISNTSSSPSKSPSSSPSKSPSSSKPIVYCNSINYQSGYDLSNSPVYCDPIDRINISTSSGPIMQSVGAACPNKSESFRLGNGTWKATIQSNNYVKVSCMNTPSMSSTLSEDGGKCIATTRSGKVTTGGAIGRYYCN